MKTVLVPGAPWPVWKGADAQPKPKPAPPKPKPKIKPPKKPRSKIANTNAKFIEWAGRNL